MRIGTEATRPSVRMVGKVSNLEEECCCCCCWRCFRGDNNSSWFWYNWLSYQSVPLLSEPISAIRPAAGPGSEPDPDPDPEDSPLSSEKPPLELLLLLREETERHLWNLGPRFWRRMWGGWGWLGCARGAQGVILHPYLLCVCVNAWMGVFRAGGEEGEGVVAVEQVGRCGETQTQLESFWW